MKFSNILKHSYIFYLFKIFTFSQKILKFLKYFIFINFLLINFPGGFLSFVRLLYKFFKSFQKCLCLVNFCWISPPRSEIQATLLKILFDAFSSPNQNPAVNVINYILSVGPTRLFYGALHVAELLLIFSSLHLRKVLILAVYLWILYYAQYKLYRKLDFS